MKRYGFAVGLLAITLIATVAVLGFDVSLAAAHASHLPLYGAELGALGATVSDTELKGVFNRIGEAFDAFKKAHDEEVAGIKKGFADVVTADKLVKINESLDKSVEAKAALEAKLEAEKKHIDEIEKKINKLGLTGGNASEVKRELELKELNAVLAGVAADRKRQFTPLDQKGFDEYKAAQLKYFREGKENLSPDEVKTLAVGSDPDGGYFVLPDLTGRIVKKVFETSPVRQFATTQPISTDALEGIEDTDEAGAGYAGERSTSGDTKTPQVGKWRIGVHPMDTEPKATQQLLDDASVDVEAWLGGKVADKRSRFENAEFVNGTQNANRIRGFIGGYTVAADSGSGVTWGTIGYLGTGTNADFPASNPADKLYDLVGLLKNAYLPNSRFFTRRSVITKIRKFKDGVGNYLWQPSFALGTPETVMGYPVARMEDVPTLANGSLSLAFGDLAETYTIVDRQGIRVLRDPFTAKPYIKFYTTWRTGGGVVNFESMKLLKFS
jgi:HK97 family phage major capsid protein